MFHFNIPPDIVVSHIIIKFYSQVAYDDTCNHERYHLILKLFEKNFKIFSFEGYKTLPIMSDNEQPQEEISSPKDKKLATVKPHTRNYKKKPGPKGPWKNTPPPQEDSDTSDDSDSDSSSDEEVIVYKSKPKKGKKAVTKKDSPTPGSASAKSVKKKTHKRTLSSTTAVVGENKELVKQLRLMQLQINQMKKKEKALHPYRCP